MIKLKHLRRKNNISQLQIADFLHISPSTVALWELNEKTPSLGHILALCRILNCFPEDLFTECEPCNGTATLPVFQFDCKNSISFLPVPADKIEYCHFGVVINQSLSPRINKGDVCFFQLGQPVKENDLVVVLDKDYTAHIIYSNDVYESNHTIVAVCRFLQSKF